jgi:hypothetical protein
MSNLRSLIRPHFFFGKLLTAEDLSQEQTYFIEKSKRHNRNLHGFGIVTGLRVSTDAGQIKISAGMALDCEGNEIVISSNQSLVGPSLSSSVAFVSAKYAERGEGTIPPNEPAVLTEGFELFVAADNENRGHRHVRGRWLSCGQPHAITLAKLRRSPNGWRVDRRYRAPVIK